MNTSCRSVARKANTKCECAFKMQVVLLASHGGPATQVDKMLRRDETGHHETKQVACRSVYAQFTENKDKSQRLEIFHTEEAGHYLRIENECLGLDHTSKKSRTSSNTSVGPTNRSLLKPMLNKRSRCTATQVCCAAPRTHLWEPNTDTFMVKST